MRDNSAKLILSCGLALMCETACLGNNNIESGAERRGRNHGTISVILSSAQLSTFLTTGLLLFVRAVAPFLLSMRLAGAPRRCDIQFVEIRRAVWGYDIT